MNSRWSFRPALLAAALLLAVAARPASAHFLWITIEPVEGSPRAGAVVGAFLAEHPVPEGPEFLKYVQGVTLTVDGQPLPLTAGEETLEARWLGKLPPAVDAARELGIRTRGDESYRLVYTARAQVGARAADAPEAGDKLRVRLIEADGRAVAEVLFDGKPLPGARLKLYPELGDPSETTADDKGRAVVEGLAEGKTALWANHGDGQPGERDGKPYGETRYYATLTVRPEPAASAAPSTAFATMPEPAVNSFGGAVLGDWLYVYSGHVGKTHRYSEETTSKHFRRLNLRDGATWEDLPMTSDLQGVALVSDGRYLYRTGGMAARNKVGTPHDLHSVADFARFDPETKTWTDLPSMPEPRSTHDAAVVGRTLYVVGGWTMKGGSEESDFCEGALAFDLDRPEAGWRAVAQPFYRRALAAAEAGGKLYVLGGLTEDMKVERRVDVYDPASDTWTQGPDLPGSARTDGFAPSAFGIAGRLYQSGASGRIYRLSASGDAWELLGAWHHPRLTHRLLPGPDGTLLAVGGNTKGQQTPVIEAVSLTPVAAPTPVAAQSR